MAQLLAFGTVWFWIIILLASALIILSTEDDETVWGSNVWFGIMILALYFLGNSEFFKSVAAFMLHNPGISLGIFFCYVLAGTVWSIFKWFFFLKRTKLDWQKRHPNNDAYFDIEHYKVAKNKARIIIWMIYWPWSAAWTLVNDPVKKTFEFVLFRIENLYNKMSAKILGDLGKK